jgi:hypothetical protein
LIEIPRSVLCQFRQALKRSFPPRSRPEQKLWVVIEAGSKMLTIRSMHTDAGISVQLPGHHAPELLTIPAHKLDDVQGRQGMVILERHGEKVIARFDDVGVPRVLEFESTDPSKLSFPSLPASLVTNPPELLKALDNAMHSAAVDSVRYATCKVQLRGQAGEIVATDGRQLLMQGGFKFPWKDSPLVSRTTLFGAGIFDDHAPVKIGRAGKHVVIQAGQWTVALTADTESRFPNVEQVIPKPGLSTLTLSAADVDALLQTLPKMPGLKDDNSPITVDCNGKIVVRAKGDGNGRVVELPLEQSKFSGPAVKFSSNRELLARALQLGFHEVRIVNADTPLLCREKDRLFVWMPLPKASCVAANSDAIVIHGSNGKPASTINHERRKAVPRRNCKHVTPAKVEPVAAKPAGLGDLIEEARGLRAAMRSMFSRSKNLLDALQLHRRKARIVDSTLASLKKLQTKVQ